MHHRAILARARTVYWANNETANQRVRNVRGLRTGGELCFRIRELIKRRIPFGLKLFQSAVYPLISVTARSGKPQGCIDFFPPLPEVVQFTEGNDRFVPKCLHCCRNVFHTGSIATT